MPLLAPNLSVLVGEQYHVRRFRDLNLLRNFFHRKPLELYVYAQK
jgi:hypothetical protein